MTKTVPCKAGVSPVFTDAPELCSDARRLERRFDFFDGFATVGKDELGVDAPARGEHLDSARGQGDGDGLAGLGVFGFDPADTTVEVDPGPGEPQDIRLT